jgi:hypothetical protein
MPTAETARRLLVDAGGDALCDSCLASACSASLTEMRQVTDELVAQPSFQRRDRCVSCRRIVPAICFAAKCVHCSRAILPREDAVELDGDMYHAACLTQLSTDQIIRISQKVSERSRRLIESTQRRIREQGRWDTPPR